MAGRGRLLPLWPEHNADLTAINRRGLCRGEKEEGSGLFIVWPPLSCRTHCYDESKEPIFTNDSHTRFQKLKEYMKSVTEESVFIALILT